MLGNLGHSVGQVLLHPIAEVNYAVLLVVCAAEGQLCRDVNTATYRKLCAVDTFPSHVADSVQGMPFDLNDMLDRDLCGDL